MLKLIVNLILLLVITVFVYFLFFTKKHQIQPIIIDAGISESDASNILNIIEKNKHYRIVKNILNIEEVNRLSIKKDIQDIQDKIKIFCENNQYICHNLKYEKIKKRILKDQKILYNFGYDKMEIFESAMSIMQNKANFHSLLIGVLPENIFLDWDRPTFLGGVENTDDKGSAKILGLIMSLAYIGNEFIVDDKPLISFDDNKYLAISYEKKDLDGNDYTFKNILFTDSKDVFIFSSIFDINKKINTIDLMSIYGENHNSGYVEWNNDSVKYRRKLLQKIRSEDVESIEDVTIGMIIAERYFDDEKSVGYSAGIGGRMAIVIGIDRPKKQIICISSSDQISNNRSGFGIDIYNYEKNNTVLQMFFKIID